MCGKEGIRCQIQYTHSNFIAGFLLALFQFSNRIYPLPHRWKIQCKMPPKTKRFYPLVPK